MRCRWFARLALGTSTFAAYLSKVGTRAAYWDGRNEVLVNVCRKWYLFLPTLTADDLSFADT